MMRLSAFPHRDNSLNALRLGLAVCVIVSHAWPLGGFGPDPAWGSMTLGHFAVAGFFAISGWLITRSRLSSELPSFAWRRFLRIYPGFFVALLVVAFVFAPLGSALGGGEYSFGAGLTYVAQNAFLYMNDFSVAGGPTAVPYPGAWAGPLWTLFYEALCYAAVGLLVTVVGRRRLPVFLGAGWLLLTALSLADALLGVHGPSFTPFFIELAPYFFAGALLYVLRERAPMHWSLAAGSAVVVGIVPALGAPSVLVALPLGYLLLWLGAVLPLGAVGRRNDVSYGMYVYGFPVQQVLVLLGAHDRGLPVYVLLGIVATLPLAALSWFAVERPAQRLKGLVDALPAPRSMAVEPSAGRVASLDGLRGVAALVVLVHHALLLTPTFFAAYSGTGSVPREGAWWWTYTPLHLLWAGDEAVLVFFVLSGLVLALPAMRWDREGWFAYYVRRFPRLYIPVWGSLVLATVLAWVVTRGTVPGAPLPETAVGPTPRRLVEDAVLLTGPSGLNGPLWSLQLEVIFSLLLPVYVILALVLRRWLLPITVGALAVTAGGFAIGSPMAAYLPVFAVGVVLAVEWERIGRFVRSIDSRWGTLLLVVAGVLLVNDWLVPTPLAPSLTVLGAALLVIGFGWLPQALRFGSARVVQHLGRLSFSLYLVHWPVVVSVALVLGSGASMALQVALGVLLSLVLAEVFYRLVEGPSHTFAKLLARTAVSRRRRERAALDASGRVGAADGAVRTIGPPTVGASPARRQEVATVRSAD
jgi:peptidoglycan/LPS O-acetylase OafA/YrhL